MSVLAQRFTEALNADRPTVAMFYDPADPRCREEMPAVLKAADEEGGKARFFEIDITANPDLKEKYNIHATPTFILFSDGQEAWRAEGRIPTAELEDMVTRFD